MFEWDRNNLRKIRARQIKREEVEQALPNNPIPIYEQEVEGELRFVYYGGRSVQIVIRLPPADLAQARKLAERKGLGYQTLLKMLVHEGLAREARRR